MPFISPSACFTAWPSAMPTSSVVWCWSICRSPLALTVMSMREWRAKRSSMWSRKPMPVAIEDAPVPSRSIATSTSVSLVVRLTEPLRMELPKKSAAGTNGERLLSGVWLLRYCSMDSLPRACPPKPERRRRLRGRVREGQVGERRSKWLPPPRPPPQARGREPTTVCNGGPKSLNQRDPTGIIHADSLRILARHDDPDGPQGRDGGNRRRRAGLDRADHRQGECAQGAPVDQGR